MRNGSRLPSGGRFCFVVAKDLWRGYLVATGILASSSASNLKSNCRRALSLARVSCRLRIFRLSLRVNSSMTVSLQGSLAQVGEFRPQRASQIDACMGPYAMHAYKSGGHSQSPMNVDKGQ